jgi:hypothetical protein
MSTRADQDQVVFISAWGGLLLFWVGVIALVVWSLS